MLIHLFPEHIETGDNNNTKKQNKTKQYKVSLEDMYKQESPKERKTTLTNHKYLIVYSALKQSRKEGEMWSFTELSSSERKEH